MIYISGKITGTTDYLERFKNAQKHVETWGEVVINPAEINDKLPKICKYSDYIKVSLCLLSLCDKIYMLSDWEESNGAKLEHAYAVANNYTIIYQVKENKK